MQPFVAHGLGLITWSDMMMISISFLLKPRTIGSSLLDMLWSLFSSLYEVRSVGKVCCAVAGVVVSQQESWWVGKQRCSCRFLRSKSYVNWELGSQTSQLVASWNDFKQLPAL